MTKIVKIGQRWVVESPDKGFSAHRSFKTRKEAAAWLATVQAEHSKQFKVDMDDPSKVSLGEILHRYLAVVTPSKRRSITELYKMRVLQRLPIAALTLSELKPKHIAAARDQRLTEVGRDTVRIEMATMARAVEVARREWGLELAVNPFRMVSPPKPGDSRDRRLEPGELERLLSALRNDPLMQALVLFAIETAMRRGELFNLQWGHVDLPRWLLKIVRAKNGSPRTIPLSEQATAILNGLNRQTARVFSITERQAYSAWVTACKKAGIEGLRFHDLRHEAISRLFEMGLSVPEVSLISGHKTASMLFRYTNLRAVEIGRKLRSSTWPPTY